MPLPSDYNVPYINDAEYTGFDSGTDATQANLYEAAAALGRMSGQEAIQKWGREGADRNALEAAQYVPEGPNEIRHIKDVKGLGQWASNTFQQNAPQLLAQVGAGIVLEKLCVKM